LTFDVSATQEFYMKEISSMDFPQHGEVFYFYGHALHVKYIKTLLFKHSSMKINRIKIRDDA
jgi:hypothetical protein